MPIHFLWGDEDFLIEKTLNGFKKQILNDDINELNYRAVDNPSFSLFSELLRTNAMMFGDILLVIKCSKYFLETKNKEKLDDKQTKELIDALNNLSDRVHLVLICPTPRGEGKKPDSRKKIFKEIQKLANIQEFQSYRNYEDYKLVPIILQMAKELDLKISQADASFLVQTTGASLRDLNTQLEKLKLFAYPSNVVTQKMIEEIASNNADIFTLIDLVLNKELSSSLNLISEILQKEHYLSSLAFMQTVVTNLLRTKIYSKSMSSFDIAVKLNQKKFLIDKNIEKMAKISLDDLIRLKINLTEAEYKLKTGTIKDPLCAYELAFVENSLC